MFFCLPKSCPQTNTWNPSPIPCHPTKTTNFQALVFCRRAIHWYSEEQTTLYFNVEKECFNPIHGHASVFVNPYDISYFGQSGGHLRINTTSRQQQNWKCWNRRKITLTGQYRSWRFKSTHYFLVGKRSIHYMISNLLRRVVLPAAVGFWVQIWLLFEQKGTRRLRKVMHKWGSRNSDKPNWIKYLKRHKFTIDRAVFVTDKYNSTTMQIPLVLRSVDQQRKGNTSPLPGKGNLWSHRECSITSPTVIVKHSWISHRNFLYGLPASSSCMCCHHRKQSVRSPIN